MRDPRSRCATPAADMPRVGCARAALLLGPLSLALPVARTPRRSDPRRTDPRRSDPWTPIHRRRGYIKYRDVSGRCIDNHLPVRPDTEGNRYIFLIQCISDTVDTAIHGDTSYRMYHPPSSSDLKPEKHTRGLTRRALPLPKQQPTRCCLRLLAEWSW